MTDNTNPTEDDFFATELGEKEQTAAAEFQKIDAAMDEITADMRSAEDIEAEESALAEQIIGESAIAAEDIVSNAADEEEIDAHFANILKIMRSAKSFEERMDEFNALYTGTDSEKNIKMLPGIVNRMSKRQNELGNRRLKAMKDGRLTNDEEASLVAVHNLQREFKRLYGKATGIVSPVAEYIDNQLTDDDEGLAKKDLIELLNDADRDKAEFDGLIAQEKTISNSIKEMEKKVTSLEGTYLFLQARLGTLQKAKFNLRDPLGTNKSQSIEATKKEINDTNNAIKELTGKPYDAESVNKDLGDIELTEKSKIAIARAALIPVKQKLLELRVDIEERTRILSIIETDNQEFNSLMDDLGTTGEEFKERLNQSTSFAARRAKTAYDREEMFLAQGESIDAENQILSTFLEQTTLIMQDRMKKAHQKYDAIKASHLAATEEASNMFSEDGPIADFTKKAVVSKDDVRLASKERKSRDEEFQTFEQARMDMISAASRSAQNVVALEQLRNTRKKTYTGMASRYTMYSGAVENGIATLISTTEDIVNIVNTLMASANGAEMDKEVGIFAKEAQKRAQNMQRERISRLKAMKQNMEDITRQLSEDAITSEAISKDEREVLEDTALAVEDMQQAQDDRQAAPGRAAVVGMSLKPPRP